MTQTKRVALYARYSSDLQNERSADDQLAALRAHAQRQGYVVAREYADRGLSGSTLATRPAIRELLRDAPGGLFDVVLVEGMDRLSRGQADAARVYELLEFCGVELETLARGIATELNVGLEGLMNRMFLVDLGKKTRRGQIARVEAGFSGGGRCYGYRTAVQPSGDRGALEIEPGEAEVIRRIFRDYAAGASPRAIARQLNAERVPGPRGGPWQETTIRGDRRARDGILHQELYVGVRVFNRRRFRKHPVTGRRSSVLNPPEEWIRKATPELRILDDELWVAAQGRVRALSEAPRACARKPKRLLSGLLRCILCGGPMTLHGGKFACNHHRRLGTCPNGKLIAARTIEQRVIQGVRRHLLSPAAITEAFSVLREAEDSDRRQLLADRVPMERELDSLARKLDRAQQGFLAGALDVEELKAASGPLKARRAELQGRLDALGRPSVVHLHPAGVEIYRQMAETIEDVLEADDAEEVRHAFRGLIDHVDFEPRPGKGDFKLTVHGSLARLLKLSAGKETQKAPAEAGACYLSVGAGAGFEPATFRL